MSNSKDLQILYWNADGVRSKQHELLELIKGIDIDVICICETRLTERMIFNLPGYKCYRADKHTSGRGQGVAILVRLNIIHNLLPPIKTVNLEVVGVNVELLSGKIAISSVYQSPNLPLLPSDLSNILSNSQKSIIMGDLNAKHSSWSPGPPNTHGRTLFEHMLTSDYTILAPDEPTLVHYRPELTPSVPDLVISLNVNNIANIKTINALSSNHFPVVFQVLKADPLHRPIVRFDYSKADWKGFRAHLDKNITLSSKILSTPTEINKAISELTHCLTESRSLCIPLRKDNAPSLPRHITRLITKKNRLRRFICNESCIRAKIVLRSELVILQNQINYYIKSHYNKIWTDKLKNIRNPNSDLWRIVKSLQTRTATLPPLTKNDGTLTTSTTDQCDVLAATFLRNMSLTNSKPSDQETNVSTSMLLLQLPVDHDCIGLIHPKELIRRINTLENRKAPGDDSITNIVLKNLSRKSVVYLTKIFNACLLTSYFPESWKTAKIIAVKKPGKEMSIPSSYRPISLLPSLAKLLEFLIYSRLKRTANSILIDQQFGFRDCHSTVQQLARVTEHVAHNLNSHNSTGMYLLDVEKAFDTVWHDGLLHKLILCNIPLPLVRLIHSYLSNRRFQVHLDEVKSNMLNIPAGIPQGSILGPFLFLIYLNDIPTQIRTNLACFADDTACYTSSADTDLIIDRLQLSIDLHVEYFDRWKLNLNDTKTEAILFSRSRNHPTRTLKINGHPIIWSNEVKYLGVTLDRKLNWTPHIDNLKIKGIKALNALSPILNRKSALSPHIKLALYSSLVRPCITYACPVWGPTCTTNIAKLQIVQNKAFKVAFNTKFKTNLKLLHVRANYLPIYDFILSLSKTFYSSNIRAHPNKLVSSIGQTKLQDLPYIDTYRTYKLPHHYFLDTG